jgi:hypothetical protein
MPDCALYFWYINLFPEPDTEQEWVAAYQEHICNTCPVAPCMRSSHTGRCARALRSARAAQGPRARRGAVGPCNNLASIMHTVSLPGTRK